MSTAVKDGQQRAMKAEAKQQRDPDAARALLDYEARRTAVEAQSARLRALRLAKEAADGTAETSTKRSRVKR